MRDMVVTFTVNNRPHYLAQALDSWARVRGVGSVFLEFHCEPDDECISLCRSVRFAEAQLYVNQEQLGCQRNTYVALDTAYSHSRYVVLAESDMVVSDDILELHAWARDEYKHDQRTLAMVAGRGQEAAPGGAGGVVPDWRIGWCWGSWPDRWAYLRPDWDLDWLPGGHFAREWDTRISDYWCREMGYRTLIPSMSRVQHIGVDDGINSYKWDDESHERDVASHCFSPQYPPQQYYEVT
jgi:hypothetical protein